tara:strand:- start:29 stop:949 length:921 start_codon:yes stop_codon:yes gene_type:complete
MAKIEENIIQNAMPAESKEQGLAVLGTIVTNQAMVFAEKMLPTLERKIKDEVERQAKSSAQQQLSEVTDKCPPEVEKLIKIRNNIVGQANSIIEIINKVSVTVIIASAGVNTLVKLIKVLKIAKSSLSLGSKFAPIVPGAVASGISDLDDVITNITFDTQGNAKLPPIVSAINSIAVPIALISFYIAKFISLISMLDALIGDCSSNEGDNISNNPDLVLSPISEDLVEIAETQNQAEESPNSSLYQGFILEIEKVPYSPTVDRIRAIGKNQDGIVLIQTELSFTPIGQVMINELKFIIDRDDLKAY